ncbi:MAG: lipid-A-disaccharide synthase [Caldimicrobium sp.]|nr:lipid-A-disaccharide synthase [Caldimicrobium sp.]MCX7873006.1 lipid-A-disaccharide synthase [Caldimicrobium sp.]MDW8093519.1 lipid-A-disaccharide synthase [Caldimicrobium sp.]
MRILIITGEISGDLYGALLVKRVREVNPSIHFIGIGGPRLRGTEAEILFSAESLSLVGIPKPSEIRKYYFIYRKIEELLKKRRVDLVLLIDFPGFNLKIAKLAKTYDYPVVYYVAPQVWAWHRNRVKTIKKCVDLLLVILPFEEEFFKRYSINVKYLGHPLLDVIKPNLNREMFFDVYQLDPSKQLVSFFPGSREGEVERHLPLFLRVYEELKRRNTNYQGIMVKAPGLRDSPLWERANKVLLVIENNQYDVLKYSDCALLASGTITLEAALLRTPAVVTYSLPSWLYFLAKHLVKVPYISLPNLILNREVYPEILQDRSSPEELSLALDKMAKSKDLILKDLNEISHLLGGPGASRRVAEEIIRFAQHIKKLP